MKSIENCQTLDELADALQDILDEWEQRLSQFARCAIVREPEDWNAVRKSTRPVFVVEDARRRFTVKPNDTTSGVDTTTLQRFIPLRVSLWNGRELIQLDHAADPLYFPIV